MYKGKEKWKENDTEQKIHIILWDMKNGELSTILAEWRVMPTEEKVKKKQAS